MRTTITIDDELFAEACRVTGESVASSVVSKAMKSMISAESRKRLLLLAGKAPGFAVPPRDSRTSSNIVAETSPDYPQEKP